MVVASTVTTAVVVLAVLVIIVVIVILVVVVYIPYRRYKNRMTETANFQFVELNQKASFWDRVKMGFRQLHDRFKRTHYQKIGLVNLSTDNTRYGTNGASGFTPYDEL